MKLNHPIVSTQWLAEQPRHARPADLRCVDLPDRQSGRPRLHHRERPGQVARGAHTRRELPGNAGRFFRQLPAHSHDDAHGGALCRTLQPARHRRRLDGRHLFRPDHDVVGPDVVDAAHHGLHQRGHPRRRLGEVGSARAVRPRRKTSPTHGPRFTARPRASMWADKQEVLRTIHDPAVCTINALQPDIYDGQINRYGRAGHIPGSHNVYYNSLLNPEDGTYLPAGPAEAAVRALGHIRPPDDRLLRRWRLGRARCHRAHDAGSQGPRHLRRLDVRVVRGSGPAAGPRHRAGLKPSQRAPSSARRVNETSKRRHSCQTSSCITTPSRCTRKKSD